jgi:hypothetical protein
MLGRRLLAGVQPDDDTEADEAGDADSWRYREEAEKDSAEAGNVPGPGESEGPEVKAGLHRRLRRGYLRLMEALARRAGAIRDSKGVVGRDELLRLHLVATLVLQATGREVEGASPCGPVLQPKDLAGKFLPGVAVLLGRSRKARPDPDGTDGPLLLRAGVALSDPETKEAACVVAVLLSALVAHGKQRAGARIRCEEDGGDAANCRELVAARSFTVLEKLGMLPARDALEQTIQLLGPRCSWVASLGGSIVAAFDDIVGRSRRINEVDGRAALEGPPPASGSITRGEWVYTLVSGVTEVIDIQGENVEVAMLGDPGAGSPPCRKVRWNYVRPTGVRRSC